VERPCYKELGCIAAWQLIWPDGAALFSLSASTSGLTRFSRLAMLKSTALPTPKQLPDLGVSASAVALRLTVCMFAPFIHAALGLY
jgi:hypothetical protein